MKQKPDSGRQEPESGQEGQNPDEKSRVSDGKSQNPDDYTLYKPPENPPEAFLNKPLKNFGEAESLCKLDHDTSESFFDEPIFCDPPKDMDYAWIGLEALTKGKISMLIDDKIIRQRDDQSVDEFIASLKRDYDDVVTLDDLIHKPSEKDEGKGIVSPYDWKHVFHECERHGTLFDLSDADALARSIWFRILVREFIKGQDPELIKKLVETHDPDVTLKALAVPFINVYRKSKDRLHRAGLSQAPLKMRGFYAGLELLVRAVQNAHDLVPSDALKSGLGSEAIESVCDEVLERVAKTEKARYEELKDHALKRHAEHMQDYVWGRRDGNLDPSLSANAKAKLFMKYVTQLQKAGVPMIMAAVDKDGNVAAVCVKRVKDIFSRGDDLDRVEAFFEQRPWITADLLSRGFREYVGIYVNGLNRGVEYKKARYYCTKVVSVSWFLAELSMIVKEITGDYGGRYSRLCSRE